MLGIVYQLSADTTVTVRFSLSLSSVLRCFFSQQSLLGRESLSTNTS